MYGRPRNTRDGRGPPGRGFYNERNRGGYSGNKMGQLDTSQMPPVSTNNYNTPPPTIYPSSQPANMYPLGVDMQQLAYGHPSTNTQQTGQGRKTVREEITETLPDG